MYLKRSLILFLLFFTPLTSPRIVTARINLNTTNNSIDQERNFATSQEQILNTSTSITSKNEQQTLNKTKTKFFSNYRLQIQIIALGLTILLSSPQQYAKLMAQLTPLQIAKTFAIHSIKALAVLVGHEYAHALTASILTNSPINVTVGGYATDKKPYFSYGGVSIVGNNLHQGTTCYKQPSNQRDYCITMAAGPIIGLLINYCYKVLYQMHLTGNISQASLQALIPDAIDIEEFNNLTIPKDGLDAIEIYKWLGFSIKDLESKTTKKLIAYSEDFSAYLKLACTYFSLNKAENSSSKFFLTLFNHISSEDYFYLSL